MSILELLGKRIIIFDGGTGTLLQEKGLAPGELPEVWNMTHREDLIEIHRNYFNAGADIVSANTFGANSLKFPGEYGYTVQEIVTEAIKNAKEAAMAFPERECFVALDIGPTGKLLKPLGDLGFEDAYALFQETMAAGEQAGADLILIETMSDTYEIKAAILAAKETTNLPVFATLIFDEKGKLLTGGSVTAAVTLLEGLGIDALGINCGLGPKQMVGILEEIKQVASIPIIVNPNAGLPRSENGKTVFDIGPQEFAETMKEIVEKGAWLVGGCCGTTPEHIEAMVSLVKDMAPWPIQQKNRTLVSSYAKAVEIGKEPILIGERINPTGKAKFKQALRENNMEYILREGLEEQEKGAHVLDVNVGLPDINEPEMMEQVICELQSIIDLPLQIDTSDPVAMERALRIYNGKPLINSVNGKQEVMESIFPLVKKYGGVVVALTLDEDGIPQSAEERIKIAKKIYEKAKNYGIAKKDILIDVLAMTISTDGESAKETLKALQMIRDDLQGNTILGVSNISFGLPQRDKINQAFFTMALQNGLSAAIINPNAEGMLTAYYSYLALSGLDPQCERYIARYGGVISPVSKSERATTEITLGEAIEKGLKDRAHQATLVMSETMEPLAIINGELIPALDRVGKAFETGTAFLPQLLMSAEAAKASFDVLKQKMEASGEKQESIGKIVIATVKGDIHDIGKNIVKVLLENYSFDVIDLGKDVPPEKVVKTVCEQNIKLVGLSALMTTTVTSMEETIKMLREEAPDCKVMVGGAVLTQEYANMIGADFYGKDSMASVYYAQELFKNQ